MVHRRRKIPCIAKDMPKMLTQEQNKIKVEITLVFELEMTVALDDSSRTYFFFLNWAGNRENRMVKAGKDKRR